MKESEQLDPAALGIMKDSYLKEADFKNAYWD